MIAGGQHVGAQVEELFGDLGREPEAAGGVFGVDDEQFDLMRLAQVVQMFAHNAAACAAEDVADEEDVQCFLAPERIQVLASSFQPLAPVLSYSASVSSSGAVPSAAFSLRIMGKRMTSRMDLLPVSSITRRSMPMPSPPVGGRP